MAAYEGRVLDIHGKLRAVRTIHYIQTGPKKQAVVLRVVTSSVIDQFKQIPPLEAY